MYYTYNIGSSVSMLVLDTNNDMSDDHTLISPLANFDQVRKAQSDWIKQNADWNQGFTHSFVIAHMAYPLSGYQEESCGWHDWAKELVDLTNPQNKMLLYLVLPHIRECPKDCKFEFRHSRQLV